MAETISILLNKFQDVLIELEQKQKEEQEQKISNRKHKKILRFVKSIPKTFYGLEYQRAGYSQRYFVFQKVPMTIEEEQQNLLKKFVYDNICTFLEMILDLDSGTGLSKDNKKITSYHLILSKYIWDHVFYKQAKIRKLSDGSWIEPIEEKECLKEFQKCFDAGLLQFEELLALSKTELAILQEELYTRVTFFKED